MISLKPLLSENVKDFMDYALDVIKSMDGAPDHNAEDKALVNQKIALLKEYLENVSLSYNENTPQVVTETINNFSGTGHS